MAPVRPKRRKAAAAQEAAGEAQAPAEAASGKPAAPAGPGPAAAAPDASEAGGVGLVAQVLAQKRLAPIASSKEDTGLAAQYSKLFAGGSNPSSGGVSKGPTSSAQAQPKCPEASTSSSAPARKRPRGAAGTVEPEDLRANQVVAGKTSAASGKREASDKAKRTPEEEQEREARTLFLGNVPLAWDVKQVIRALRGAAGDVYTGRMGPVWFRAEPLKEDYQYGVHTKVGRIIKAYDDRLADAKIAYVVLETPEAVSSMCRVAHGLKADSHHVLRADGVGAAARLRTFDRKRSVFLGNLPYSTSEAEIRAALKPAGDVDAVRVVRDRVTKACKGFAFVRFCDRKSVKAALNLWGVEVQGRQVRVMKVEQNEAEDNQASRKERMDELHPAARRLLQTSERRQRQKTHKAIARRTEAAKAAGMAYGSKRRGRSSKGRRKDVGTGGKKKKSARGAKAKGGQGVKKKAKKVKQ